MSNEARAAHEALDRLVRLVRHEEGADPSARVDQAVDSVVVIVRTALALLDELSNDARVEQHSRAAGAKLDGSRSAIEAALRRTEDPSQ